VHDAGLLARYANSRDPRLREQLVHRYLPLARSAASQYARGGDSFDDLMQIASIGLLKAIDRYDPDRGSAFSSYAMPTMTGELRRHFRDHGWAVRPPRDLQEDALVVERATGELLAQLGRAPTVDQIAERTGLDAEAVLDAREAMTARTAASLALPSGGGGDGDGDDLQLEDRLGRPDEGFARAEARASLAVLQRSLTPREREILRLRFEEDLTQAQIGERVGVSQMHVSRMLRVIIAKLRRQARHMPETAA
jgi:RNA polymerase sigma-B factor